MEGVLGIHRVTKLASEDVISSMPDSVVTNILDRLPLHDAVRTSILARNWRLKWTLLTQLVFDTVNARLGPDNEKYSGSRIVNRILLNLKGPITKFVIYMMDDKKFDVEDLNHWVLFLSRKGIKEFTLFNSHHTPLNLPTHLFSCVELTHLSLQNCVFNPPPTFHGFPNLLSLDFWMVYSESINCGEFITQSPLLEKLEWSYHGEVKLVEIAKLENLKYLWLSLSKLDIIDITSSTIFELGGYLPKLEGLNLNFQECKFLGETGARKWVRTSFLCLKTLTLCPIDFSSDNMLSFAFEMIWGSSNLHTLTIVAKYEDDTPPPAFCHSKVDNNTMKQLQLRNVRFSLLRGSENELFLVKSILACSPFLKKIDISLNSSRVFGGDQGKLMFASKLLELPRSSPIAQVKLCKF